nr:hypothetical protein [Pseudomonas aeruginosa]
MPGKGIGQQVEQLLVVGELQSDIAPGVPWSLRVVGPAGDPLFAGEQQDRSVERHELEDQRRTVRQQNVGFGEAGRDARLGVVHQSDQRVRA